VAGPAYRIGRYHRPVTRPDLSTTAGHQLADGSPTGHPVPPGPLSVAAGQAEAVPSDLAGNASTAARLTTRAVDLGARLVVLPELFLPAYDPSLLRAEPDRTDLSADEAGRIGDARLDPLRAAARQGATVVVGAAVRHADGRRTCSLLVVDRAGEVRASYDKQHLWGADEQELFTPGRRGTTLLVEGWRIALGICYDGCFPEHGRAGADHGVHAYLYPSGYVIGSEHRRDLYYRARALDNTSYVVFANLVGGVAPWRFNGGAAVYDPEGRLLGRAPDEGEAVLPAVLEPAELVRVRAAHTMLLDRRADQGDERVVLAV
jgi:predicted amidohydrolase